MREQTTLDIRVPPPENWEDDQVREMSAVLFFLGYVGVGGSITQLIIRWMLPVPWTHDSRSVSTFGWVVVLGGSLLVVVSSLAVLAGRKWGRDVLVCAIGMAMVGVLVIAPNGGGLVMMLVLAFLILFLLNAPLRGKMKRLGRSLDRRRGSYGDLHISVLWICAILLVIWIVGVIFMCKSIQL